MSHPTEWVEKPPENENFTKNFTDGPHGMQIAGHYSDDTEPTLAWSVLEFMISGTFQGYDSKGYQEITVKGAARAIKCPFDFTYKGKSARGYWLVASGVLPTIVAAGIADVVVVWSCALVYDTRLGAALLGCLGALVLSHVWASCRALATVWWSCGLVLLCVVGMAVYAWVRAGLSPVDPVVVETLAPILPVAACTAVGTGYVWRLCARLVADHRSL